MTVKFDNLKGIVVTNVSYLEIYVLKIYHVSHTIRDCQLPKLAAAMVKVAAAMVKVAAACVLYWRPP